MCSSDIGGIEMLAQSTACRMDTGETPATKAADAAATQTQPRDTCV